MAVILRPATDSDFPSIVTLMNSAFRGAEGWSIEGDLIKGQRTNASLLSEETRNGAFYLLAKNDETSALDGCVSLQKCLSRKVVPRLSHRHPRPTKHRLRTQTPRRRRKLRRRTRSRNNRNHRRQRPRNSHRLVRTPRLSTHRRNPPLPLHRHPLRHPNPPRPRIHRPRKTSRRVTFRRSLRPAAASCLHLSQSPPEFGCRTLSC